jgi:peptide/nickel transport system substrate-binding protein
VPQPTATAVPQPTATATPRPPAATATAVPQPTATKAPMMQKGGTLKIASVGSVQSFDPLWTTASGTGNVSSTILEGLLTFTDDYGLGKLLIDSWATKDNGLVWEFKIRQGVKFHDGTPLTTDQVIGTLNRQKDGAPVLKLVREQFGPESKAFEDFVKKVDAYTFTINLREATGLVPASIGPQNFAPLIVTDAWAKVSQKESAPGNPIGTGPYKFEKWTPGDRWSAVRYEEYKASTEPANGTAGKQEALFDRVEWIEIPDQTTRVAALETGEVDMAQEFPADLAKRLEANPKIQLVALTPLRLLGHFNHVKPPFNNVLARKAVVTAYDNPKALLLATGDQAAYKLCPSLMQCGTQWETTAGSSGLYNARNLEAAKKLLAESGHTGAKVRLMDPTDRQPAHAAAQVSREVLTDLGFKVEFLVMDWATMVSRRADPELWEFFHTWSGSTVRTGPVGHLSFGELQYNAWFNKYQDVPGKQRDLLAKLARETDVAKQKRIMDEFQTYFYDDAIFLQVGEFFSRWAARSDLKGIVPQSPAAQLPANKWIAK